MNTHNRIINDILPFENSTRIKDVQDQFKKLRYSHLPIVNNGVFAGCLSEADIHSFDEGKKVVDYEFALEDFFVAKTTNWLDILEAFAIHNSNIIPVIDKNKKYIGYYELNDIIGLFNNTPFLNEAGGIIVVEKGIRDYSFSEICQIVESNDSKILGLFISKIEKDLVEVTIKIGHSGMNAVAHTFRRYSYNVVSSHEEDTFIEDLKDRSNYLDKYLNI